MKKLLLYSKWVAIILFGIIFFWSKGNIHAQGQWGYADDCTIYANTDADKYGGVVEKRLEKRGIKPLEFFTDEDLRTAVLHHQMACCEEILKDDRAICEQAKEDTSDCKNCYAHSNYLFDHLVNIGMRKFDGIQEQCDSLHISCKMNKSAVKTLERRERITEISQDVEWYPPSLIMEEFLKYRGDESKESVNDVNTISNAYYAMCQEAENIVDAIGVNQQVDPNAIRPYVLCRQLVEKRYQQEYSYVRTLMVEKGVQYFIGNAHDYMQEYFIKNRMSELVNKYARMDNCFTTVLRYATKTSCCSD